MESLDFVKEKIKKDGLKVVSLKMMRFLLTHLFYQWDLFIKVIKEGMPSTTIKEINGFKMLLDLRNDKGISRDLFIYGKREFATTNLLLSSNILKKGDVVLDIGANIGYYALLESKLVGEEGIVYALEPVKKNFELLKENIKLNNINNIEIFKLAAGDENKKCLIHISKKGNWSSLVYRKGMGFYEKEEVDVVKIDEFLKDKRKPTFIRMDVEGYEYAIIKGMEQTLELDNLKLLIEIHGHIMTEMQVLQMIDTLESKGFYKVLLIYEPYLGWINPQGKIRTSIKYLTKKIGDGIERLSSEIRECSISYLKDYVLNKKSCIQALIYKN